MDVISQKHGSSIQMSIKEGALILRKAPILCLHHSIALGVLDILGLLKQHKTFQVAYS